MGPTHRATTHSGRVSHLNITTEIMVLPTIVIDDFPEFVLRDVADGVAARFSKMLAKSHDLFCRAECGLRKAASRRVDVEIARFRNRL